MPIDYKNTLCLPETAFPMKANLSQREPQILQFWQEREIYRKIQEKNKGKKHYILHDGPPYANGNIHIGHALNKILKDIIIKFRAMNGLYSPYVPGWDCHGLPIELQIDKNLGDKKDKTSIPEKRQLCRQYAMKYVNIQRDEFIRLGVFGDWKRPYLTMTEDYESAIAEEFLNFVRAGYVYKGKKPVHWCPSCVTALAEAEVEYADKESPSVYVRFKLKDDSLPGLKGKDVYLLIWTTTPWTLPANLAIAVNPEFEYVAVSHNNDVLIIAKNLKERLFPDEKIIAEYKGKDLEGIKAEHPFIKRDSVVILGEFVTAQEGTGIVH
ncbi:MAG: class I tRNA ligase family protein, partial [Thermodesulfovibrionales bacterium]